MSTEAGAAMDLTSRWKHWDGEVRVYKHASAATRTDMQFSVFLPARALASDASVKVPCIYWLSGLTCTHENFTQKGGAFRAAAAAGVAVVVCDTSPRGAGVEGETASWDFGIGAGFYVDATQPLWRKNYNMFTYVTAELPALCERHLPLDGARTSIMGHSMGGLGALLCALKCPGKYRAVSAFAPISNPSSSPSGIKGFTGYLGDDRAEWAAFDPCHLVAEYKGPALPVFIAQGLADDWLARGELLPANFLAAAQRASFPVEYTEHAGYDHGFYFISTFIADHIARHAALL